VLTTTRRVVEQSRYVHIDESALASLAPGLSRRLKRPEWDGQGLPVDETERTANLLLVLDALNFSFWGDPRWQVGQDGDVVNGYRALVACLARAVREGVPIADAHYLATMSAGDLAHVLRGENSIPWLDRRLENLHEVGEALLRRHDGSFARAIESCGGSAVRLVKLVVDTFLSFEDVADHSGGEVRFYKRAQILAADLHGAFKGESWGRFGDLDQLTAFADYKLPQILRHMGILVYLPSLAQKIEARFLLPASSREEVEIRANTIWAVELLRRALARHGGDLRAFELDWWLWGEAQRFGPTDDPYHLTRTVYY
jgi:hypothetical protein